MEGENENTKERKKISKNTYIQAILSAIIIPLGFGLLIYLVAGGIFKIQNFNDVDKILVTISTLGIIISIVVATFFGTLDIKYLIEERKRIN